MPDIIDPRTPVARAARPCIPSVFICAPSVAPSSLRFVAPSLRRFPPSGSFRGRFGVIWGSFWGRLGVILGSVWGRFGVGLGSVYYHLIVMTETLTPGPASTSIRPHLRHNFFRPHTHAPVTISAPHTTIPLKEHFMQTRIIGIILNGVTGRMGTNQHLVRSILAIIKQGGLKLSDDLTLLPDPILTGRNEAKLAALARAHGLPRYTTNLQQALDDPHNEIFFDASSTLARPAFVQMAANAGKAVYCEKPTATTLQDALHLHDICHKAGLKNGVVQDKLFLPGFRKLKQLIDTGFFGQVLSVRGNFGYWVFPGSHPDQPAQRPSWNYRKADGGGIVLDMFAHWRYVLDNLFAPVRGVFALANTDLPQRVDESGKKYKSDADDSAYAIFSLQNGLIAQFNSSWCTRVRRDDLLTIQVDGVKGSAIAGLRECYLQSEAMTPKPVWNPDIPQPIDFYGSWARMPDSIVYDNAFKIEWELFLRHVVLDEPFPWTLKEGAKGVQLAECALKSSQTRHWVDVPEL